MFYFRVFNPRSRERRRWMELAADGSARCRGWGGSGDGRRGRESPVTTRKAGARLPRRIPGREKGGKQGRCGGLRSDDAAACCRRWQCSGGCSHGGVVHGCHGAALLTSASRTSHTCPRAKYVQGPPYSRLCRLPLWRQSQLSRAPIARFRASPLDYFKEEGDDGEPELLDPAACSGEVCSNGGLWCTRRSPWRWKYNLTSPGLPASPSSCCRRPPELLSASSTSPKHEQGLHASDQDLVSVVDGLMCLVLL